MKRTALIALVIAVVLVALVGASLVSAQSGNQWRGDFYNNPNWSGAPAYTQFVNFINFNWGTGSPGPGVPADNFTARFTTQAFFYAGTYRFTLLADDEIALIIDGATYLDTRNQGQSGKQFVVDIPMTQALHNVQVDFREYTGTAYVYVNWEYLKGPGTSPPPQPGPTPTPPPSQCGIPTSTSSVQTRFGDYTPCIQQNIHQKNCFQSDGAWNSPNMGSIETEPQITLWMQCEPDSVATYPVSCDPDVPQQQYKCSKTGAGYFKN
jgi:hypothetical protein